MKSEPDIREKEYQDALYALSSKAHDYDNEGRYEEAITAFNNCLTLEEEYGFDILDHDFKSVFYLGIFRSFCGLGNYAKAGESFHKALTLDPEYAKTEEGKYWQAYLNKCQLKFHTVIPIAEELLKIENLDSNLRLASRELLALSLIEINELDKANTLLKEQMEDPNMTEQYFSDAYYNLARIYLGKNQIKVALFNFKKSHSIAITTQKKGNSLWGMAESYFRIGRLLTALIYANRALRLMSNQEYKKTISDLIERIKKAMNVNYYLNVVIKVIVIIFVVLMLIKSISKSIE